MIKYQYQLLRYVHDQFTGEFVNVGLVLFSPDQTMLNCRTLQRYGRISGFFGPVNGPFLLSVLRGFEKGVKRIATTIASVPEGGSYETNLAAITHTILPKDGSALQLTEVMYGMDIDAEVALDHLFERLISIYNPDHQEEKVSDAKAWAKVYRKYFEEYGLTSYLKKHTVKTKKDEIKFDNAWKNGTWNCFQTLAFDLKTAESIKNKVYRWSGIIRELEKSSEKLNVFLLTTEPESHKELSGFIKDTLTSTDPDLHVQIIKPSQAEQFVKKVRKEMIEHNIIETDN